MARPKKIVQPKVVAEITFNPPLEKGTVITAMPSFVVPTPIEKLAIDYSSEGLNNIARKINEIIDRLN